MMTTNRPVLLARSAFLAVGLLLLFAPTAKAQQPRIDRLEIVQAGFYRATTAWIVILGRRSALDDLPHESTWVFLTEPPTETAMIGTRFGVEFRSFGEPQDADAPLRFVLKIPAPGITDPSTGITYRESVVNFTTKIGTVHQRGYVFEESWQIVPGIWSLEIWQGDRKLLDRSFTIK